LVVAECLACSVSLEHRPAPHAPGGGRSPRIAVCDGANRRRLAAALRELNATLRVPGSMGQSDFRLTSAPLPLELHGPL
jgi:hypothetical protein